MNHLPVKLEVAARFLGRVTLVSLSTLAIALAVVLVAPKALGGQSLSVLSGSMAPHVNTGDMVMVVPQDANNIQVGQIVAFNDPNGSGRLYQHRVQSVREENGQMMVVTKGDANNTGESWQTPVDSEVGRVVLVVPYIGSIVGSITGGKAIEVLGRSIPVGTLGITIALFVLAGFVIAGILRSSGGRKDTDPTAREDNQDTGNTPRNFVQQQEEGPTHA